MILCCRTHGSRQRINSQSIQEEYKIWILVAGAYGYVVQLQFISRCKERMGSPEECWPSSAKWGLGENVGSAADRMLNANFCFDIFMDNYFTSFPLL